MINVPGALSSVATSTDGTGGEGTAVQGHSVSSALQTSSNRNVNMRHRKH